MHTHFLLFLFLFLPYFNVIYGQDYLCKKEQITVEDGLSNRFVRSIIQDSKGFMWFGTKNGLNRYDGHQFKIFNQSNSALKSNFINQIYEDADRLLWVGHALNGRGTERFKAIDVLNTNTFAIQSLEDHLGNALPFSVSDIYQIFPHTNQKWLFITTTTGKIYLYKGKRSFVTIYSHSSPSTISAFLQGEKYYWIYCDNQLIALDKQLKLVAKKALITPRSSRSNFISERTSFSICMETNDKFHLLGSWEWNIEKNELKSTPEFNFSSLSIPIKINSKFNHRHQTNTFLWQSRKGIQLFDNQKQLFFDYKTIDKKFIRSAYVDNQENIWLGVISEGLIKVSYKKKKFNPYMMGISTRSITSLAKDSLLLFNSYSGQFLYDRTHKKYRRTDTLASLAAFKCIQNDRIWLSAEDTFIRYKKLSNLDTIHYCYYTRKSLKQIKQLGVGFSRASATWALHQQANTKLWLGTANGLAFIAPGKDSIQLYTDYDYQYYPLLKNALINDFHENKKGIWVASSVGLYLIDSKSNKIIRHYHKGGKKGTKIPYNHIHYIHGRKNNILWLGTKGGGVIKLNTHTGHYEQLTIKDGLSHNVIYAILEDQYGFLWMSSDYGLMRLHPETKTINTYFVEDGLLHVEFNRKSAYKAPNGLLYFGGLAGIIEINPSDFLQQETMNPPLLITDYLYFDKQQDTLINKTQQVLQDKQIQLDYDNRFFILEFALLDFTPHERTRYSYKIKGLDDSWVFLDDNSIRINSLAPGNYVLQVRGETSTGVWSENEINLPIIVHQPFYLTWQFVLICVLFLISSIIIYARWREHRLYRAQLKLEEEVKKRTKTIERQANELRALDNVKSRFFANISHELRTPLTLMLGPIEAILEYHYGKDWEKVMTVLRNTLKNGQQLQKLIEEILELSKLEAKALKSQEKVIALSPLVRRLFLAFEAQAQLLEIKLQLNNPLDNHFYVWLDEIKFEKILNNLLSNAIKYTPKKGSITLDLSIDKLAAKEVVLHLSVIDTGRGIHPDDLPYIFDRFYQSKQQNTTIQGGTGIGLALASELTQLLNGKLTVISEVNVGSQFTLSLPLRIAQTSSTDTETITNDSSLVQTKNQALTNKQHSLLIVEDNLDMQGFLVDLLSPYYNTYTAIHGKKALELLQQDSSRIDLIVSDIMMPVMDGMELTQQLKLHSEWKKIPLIILTARADEKNKLKALHIGVDDYLKKPFSRAELMARIKNLIQNHIARQEWIAESPPQDQADKNQEEIADKWLTEVEETIKKELGNSQYTINSLAYDMNISERQLRRRIKLKTGLTPNQYIRDIKLDRARALLEERAYETVAEVAYQIGFQNVSYFSKIYLDQYGKRPSEYLK